MTSRSCALTPSEFPRNSSAFPINTQNSPKSNEFLQRINQWMRERVSILLAAEPEAHFTYRICANDDGKVGAIEYQISGVDDVRRYEIDQIVSAAVIRGASSPPCEGHSAVVQWVRVAVPHQAPLGAIDEK